MPTILTMRIDSVSANPDRVGKYKVCFGDGSKMYLYRQTIEDHCIYTGRDLTDEELSLLKEAAGKMSAKMRAVRILAASNVSRADLKQRLINKGETKENAIQAVAWMEDLALVDDKKTAQQVVNRCADKGYGLARAKQALYEKRIPKEFWDEALNNYPDQTEHITSFLRTKLTDAADEKAVRKVTDALIRRGHSYSQIRKAMEQLNIQLQEEF